MTCVFFVDEVLSSSAIDTINNIMIEGVDLTTLCDTSAGGCTGCTTDKFKVNPGPATCTNCGVHTYSTTVEETEKTTCVGCPNNTVIRSGQWCDQYIHILHRVHRCGRPRVQHVCGGAIQVSDRVRHVYEL